MIKKKTPLERDVDQELISKGKDVLKDFDESKALRVPGKKRESKLISIRLPRDMIQRLRAVAMQKGNLGYQQLIRMLLDEALSKFRVEFHMRAELLPQQALFVEDVSSASSSLGKELGFPDYEEVGEANRFQVGR